MGVTYRNIKDMSIPDFAYPNRHDGSVYIIVIDEDGKKHRKTVGNLTVDTPGSERMVPNHYFRDHYQNLWNENYPTRQTPRHELCIGMYGLTLGIAKKTGLYTNIQTVYGTEYVNNILDYVMFSIQNRINVTQVYESTMANQVLFCNKLHSDTWYSRFFSEKINEDMHHAFKIKYVEQLIKNGLRKVWLAIDGSNNDCAARQTFLTKFGFPKSHNSNKTIVGYMYAVDADTGRPVTYFVYEGDVPDSQAFQKLAVFLKGFNIEIEGVILDRGFAVEAVFAAIEECRWKYVIMLPNDTYGHLQMIQEYGETIRWKSEYILEDDVLFATSATKQLFKNNNRESNICTFFDGSGGSAQSVRLSRKILTEKKKVQRAICQGKRASISSKLKKYLSIEGEGKDRIIIEHYEAWNNSMASNGFFSLAVSDGISPNQCNRLYKSRDTSETQYGILKSQEGGHTTRVHKTEGIYSKFALMFISSVLRFEIEYACKQLELDTNETICNLDRIVLLYTAHDRYESVRNLTISQQKLFALFEMDQDHFEYLARDFNNRNKTATKNPERSLPDKTEPLIVKNSHKRGRARQPENSKTVADSTSDGSSESEVKSKGGRPLGAKDTKPRKPRSDKGHIRGPRRK